MRIAIIAPPWVAIPPRAYGGTEVVIDGLARGLARAGHEVLLFATGDSTCEVARAWHFKRAVGIGRGDGGLLEIRHVIAAYEAVRDFDLVHDHTLAGPVYAFGRHPGPIVTTNHGPFGDGLDEYYGAIAKGVGVIAISGAQAAAAGGIAVEGVIHHGVEIDDFPEGDGEGDFALFLGRMCPAKGVHVAAQAARAAGVRLLIAAKCSEPAEVAYYEDRVRPLLGKDVEFIGEVDREAKIDLLGKARCLLNPIAWPEPFGMVMIEALACGTPVVATPRGAAPEIVEDGATGFLAEDQVQLVTALRNAHRIDRKHCRRTARERFSIEAMVEGHLAVYETAIRRHGLRREARHRQAAVPSSTVPSPTRFGISREPVEARAS